MQDLNYIDCHSHPHDEKFAKENISEDYIIEKLKENKIGTIAVGTDYENSLQAINFARKYDFCWASIGIHPVDKNDEVFLKEKFDELKEIGKEKVVAIGECGLDYYYFDKTDWNLAGKTEDEEKERQKKLFLEQVLYAKENKLPLILHGRPKKGSMDAYEDMLDILEDFVKGGSEASALPTGHAHFFVGNLEIAKRFLNLGFLLSFDGPITFCDDYNEVIQSIPISKIMIETDSPYAAPKKHRGQTNFPHYAIEIAEKIAEIKQIPLDEVLKITKENTIKLFNLKI